MSDGKLYLEMTDPEIKKAISEKRILFFCVGAVEQHGAHTPTGVDIFLPMAVAQRAAAKVGGVVAPCTNYGYKSLLRSGGGPHFVGSVNLRGTTVIALVKDIISEFISHGWRRFVVLEWHLENCPFVYEGIDEAIRESNCKDEIKIVRIDNIVAPAFRNDPGIIDFVFGGDYKGMVVEHASTFETSLMLAVRPDLVQMDKAVDGSLPTPFEYDVLPVDKDAAPKSGVFDRATQATTEKGERLMNSIVDALIEIIEKEFGPIK
jgi:creatinine amidohydrolase